jgi:hypothetical protein
VQEVGEEAVGVFRELAVVADLPVDYNEKARQRGNGVFLGEGAVGVEEDGYVESAAAQEGFDGRAIFLEVNGEDAGASFPMAGDRMDSIDDVA